MGNPFKRIKYQPPEQYQGHDRIGHGESVSMITDLISSSNKRGELRRKIDNHVRYALKKGELRRSYPSGFTFSEIAHWANKRYGENHPDIKRMHHGVVVKPAGVLARGVVRTPKGLGSLDDYKEDNQKLREEVIRQQRKVAELESEIERNRPFTDTGKKVRLGGKKGGNSPKHY